MDWVSIIGTFLFPLLAKCFSGFSSEKPQYYLRCHYDEASGTMDSGLVTDAIPQTRRAIRKAYRSTPRSERGAFPRYSREELYAIAEQKLIEAMNASDEQISAAYAAAEDDD